MISSIVNAGSPTHTRERLNFMSLSPTADRITPAYAGKTRQARQYNLQSEDHPRIRGKDYSLKEFRICCLGSPPHTRERPIESLLAPAALRITPAYAGKTIQPSSFHTLSWDHPRIRGKDIAEHYILTPHIGSPPHTRERLNRFSPYFG